MAHAWGGQGAQEPNSGGTDRSRQGQYTYVHDQQVRGHTGLRTEAEGAAEYFSQPTEVHGFSGTAAQEQPALRAELYEYNAGYVAHRSQMLQHSVHQMTNTRQPAQFVEPDVNYFLRSVQQPPQPHQMMQYSSRFEQEYSAAAAAAAAAAGMHAPFQQHHLHPQFMASAAASSGQMPDDSHMFQRYSYPMEAAFSVPREQPMDRSLLPTPTWPPTLNWHHSDAFPSPSPPPSPLPDESHSSDALPSGQMFPPRQLGGNVGRPSQGRSLAPAQPSNLSHVSFISSRTPISPSPPLQMHVHSGQGPLEGAMHSHQHLAEAARSVLPASAHSSEHLDARGLASMLASCAQDRSMSPEFPFSSGPAEDYTPVADACAPLPPSGAPANTFLQTIHESEGASVAPTSERKLHNQASQCSTTTSFGGGSRRFLARNVSSFSNSSVAESFFSRNSSMRSIGGASSYDFRFDSFKDRTESSEDNSDPHPSRSHKAPMGSSAGELASSPPGRQLSAATHAAAAEAAVAADASTVAADAADPAINAAAAAAAIIQATGDIPLYLSEDAGDIAEHERQLVSDMGSLTRQLDQARSVLPAVVQVLSNTRPPLQLGLPALTKLLCNSSKRGRHAKALAIFHAAPALGLVPDLPLCNAALMAAGSAGNAAASSAIFGGMIAVGIQPDAVTYRASSTALAKQGHIQRALQVLLHMLLSERVHDSTSLMTGVLAAGRHGAWAVGELMLLTAFKNRFQLLRLASLTPPALSTVPEQFREVYLALCEHNGIIPDFDAASLPSPQRGSSPAASQHEQPPSQAGEDDNASTAGGTVDATAAAGSMDMQPGEVATGSPPHPLSRPAPPRASPLGSNPVRSAELPFGGSADGPVPEEPPSGSVAGEEATPSGHDPQFTATGAGEAPADASDAPNAAAVNANVSGSESTAGMIADATSGSVAAFSSVADSAKAQVVPLSGVAACGPEVATSSVTEGKSFEDAPQAGPRTPHRLLSMRHSAPVESSTLYTETSPPEDLVSTPAQERAAAVLAESFGQRSMRRVVSADRVRPGQKQKRVPEGGNRSVMIVRSSLEAAARAAIAAVEREELAAALVQAEAEPPKKRHLSPAESPGSGSAGGRTACGSGGASQSHSSIDRGHLAAMSPFFDSHPAEGSLIKRASSSSGASVAKLALALADARLSLTSENSMGGNPAGSLPSGQLPSTATVAGTSEPDAHVTNFLNSSGVCPMDAGAFSTEVPDDEPEDASIAAAAAASATAAVQTAEAEAHAAVQNTLLEQHIATHNAQMLDPSDSRPRLGGGGTGAQSPTTSSAITGLQNVAGAAREEESSQVVPSSSDPLLHACFNAQLLAYSTDPALLDRSTEILMIMLESGGQISPDVISFNIILRTVCATEHFHVAPALLEMMGIACVTPLVSTYSIYMAGAASAGDPWLVEQGWQAMLSANIVPDITCITLYLSALFQLGQCIDAATLFLRIASPPVFLAPDADLIAMILSIWMHHQLAIAGAAASNMERNVQRTAATQQDTFAMTSSLCHAIGAHAEVAIEATQILIEELVRAGRFNAMQAALTAQQQLVASRGAPHPRVPTAQIIGQVLTTMLHGGVAKCAGTCVGGLVRRACESILRLGGAPLPDGDPTTSTAVPA